MIKNRGIWLSIWLLSCFVLTSVQAQEQAPWYSIYSLTDASWDDVNEDLKEAIEDRGIVISYTSHAQALLARTAKELGVKKQAYHNAEIHLFCQVQISHQMSLDNPHIIAACPYGISVYSLTEAPQTVYLSFRNHPDKRVQALLKSIVEGVIE